MSIGKSPTKEKIDIKTFDKIRYTTKKVVENFFKEPLYYLFYIMMVATIIGLFFGKCFSWQYYFILIVLSANEIYNKFMKK